MFQYDTKLILLFELISLLSAYAFIHAIDLILHELFESLLKLHCSMINQLNEILLGKGLSMSQLQISFDRLKLPMVTQS